MVGGSYSSFGGFGVLSNLEAQSIGNSYLSQSFQEQRQVDSYIRNTKIFKIVEGLAKDFVEGYRSPKRPEDSFKAFVIKLPVVYCDILNHSLDLLHFLLEEPIQFENSVKYCVFAVLRAAVKEFSQSEDIEKIIDIDQVHVLIRFVGLPLQKNLCFQPHTNSYQSGISEVIGILSAISEPGKLFLQSVWYCSTGCERNKIRTNLLDAPICASCSHPMNEYTKLRYTEKYHLLRILPVESLESPRRFNKIFRSVNVRVPEHVFDCQLILGNRYIIFDSLRELSESQLEALLRFDSPPETQVQPADALILYENASEKNLNITKNEVGADSLNCLVIQHRQELSSELDSQIDFSIFHHYSPNNQWSPSPLNIPINESDHSIIVTSALNNSNISAISTPNKDETNFGGKLCTELNTNANASCANICDLIGKQDETEHLYENESSYRKNYDFGEVDDLFKQIDFLSDFEQSCINKLDSSNCVRQKYQTQLEYKSGLENSHEKIAISCPPRTERNFSSNTKELYANISKISLPDNFMQFNNTKSSVIAGIDDDNKDNQGTKLCLSFDKNLCGQTEIDVIFDKTQSEHIFGDSHSCHETSQNKTNSRHSFEKGNSQPCTTKKYFNNKNLLMDVSSIPCSVRQLYDVVKDNYSDFSFIYSLSSQLCQDRVPMECFVTLKMALLLSLVSIGSNENRPPIPIVAMSNDTYMTDYLMTNIGQLGSRFLGPIDDTKSFSNANWIEADHVLLAQGGVYYAGDWTRLKVKKSETIFKIIECSTVVLEKSSFPLETAIWTHWRSFKYGAKDQQMFNKFLKIFGLPIFVSDDNHEALIDYTLEQSSVRVFESTVDHLSVNEDDMRNFLVCVSQNNVDLSPEAALLLRNYFVASRSIRQDCLSTQSYAMLKQFAESFAKLSMRNVVLPDDALAAIIMCEHFIENIFSSSNNSPPHFGSFTSVGEVDKYLLQFKEWLQSYTENFTNA